MIPIPSVPPYSHHTIHIYSVENVTEGTSCKAESQWESEWKISSQPEI
jgi:hypothetical protein